MEKLVLSQKVYDFLLYIYPVVAKFPKYEKFTLQAQVKNCVIDAARSIIRANKSTTKKSHLYEADVLLEELRMLIRLSHDLRYINPHQYGVISGKLAEIGRERFAKSLQSWLGHIQHADTYRLRRRMLERIKSDSQE